MRRILALTTLLFAVFLVGCSDDDGGSTPATDGGGDAAAPQDDASSDTGGGCAVLSASEVGDVVGAEVTASTELPLGCMWALGEEGPDVTYEWQGLPEGGYEANQGVSGFAYEPIDGLGDDAFVRSAESGGDAVASEVWVQSGDESFFVRASGLPNSDEVLTAEQEIAQLLVDQLG